MFALRSAGFPACGFRRLSSRLFLFLQIDFFRKSDEVHAIRAKACVRLDNFPPSAHKPPMLSRLGHLLLIFALLGATGGHWAALQSVAWARMLAKNARVAPLSEALEKTFDGKHLCPLCKQIAKGRQNEKKSDRQIEVKKLEFLRLSTAFVFASPAHFDFLREQVDIAPSLTHSPPVPPPRSLPS